MHAQLRLPAPRTALPGCAEGTHREGRQHAKAGSRGGVRLWLLPVEVSFSPRFGARARYCFGYLEPKLLCEHRAGSPHRPRAELPRLVPVWREPQQLRRIAAGTGRARHAQRLPALCPALGSARAAGNGSNGGSRAGRRAGPARAGRCAPPPPRTKWTRRVPHPVLIGPAASHSPCGAVRALAGAAPAQRAYYEVVHSLCVLNGNEHLHPPVARAQLGAAAAPRASRAPAMQEAAQGAAGHLRRWRAALWERPSPTQHAAPTRSRPAARAHPGFRGRAFRAPNPLKSGVSPSARWR